MLLTLSAKSVWPASGANGASDPFDLPRWAREDLDVHGLTLQTSLLSGWALDRLERFRDAADKAGAPCLLLVEDTPMPLATEDAQKADAAIERADRVLRVAHRLGCSSVAISILGVSNPSLEVVTPRLKAVLSKAERLELNLLLGPSKGLTESPEKLTSLIRKVGGFRIGSYPDFQAASQCDDPIGYLRSLSPYASAICASVQSFDSKGQHSAYDIKSYVTAIQSVGYEAALTLEYRGSGDASAALRAAKSLVESCLKDDGEPADAELDPEEDADEA